jgi:hypothetical protein|tara:strand:- start:3982 stop:4410 length:429 start_codon:yes stop_codon:yes gene_type:complete
MSELGTAKYSAVLQLRGGASVVPADFFIVAGQSHTEPKLLVACGAHSFQRTVSRQRASAPVVIAEGSAAESLSSIDTLSLRIGIIDRRPGRSERGFLGQAHDVDEGWDDEEADAAGGQMEGSMSDSMSDSDSMHGSEPPYWV